MAYVPDEAFDRVNEVTPKAFILYGFYCKRRASKGEQRGKAWPSLQSLAKDMQLSVSSVCEFRRQLVAKKWIQLEGDKATLLVGFSTLDHSEKSNEAFGKVEWDHSEKSNPNSEFPNPNSEKSNEAFGISELHIRKNHEIEPAQLTSPHEPARTRDDGVTLSDALLELFPHLEALNKNAERLMRECVSLCLRLKVTPDKVPKWRIWLVSKWPLANAKPEKFLETLNQFLQEECSNGSHTEHYELAPTNSARPGLSAAERRRLNRLEIEAYFLDIEPEALART